MMYLKNSPLVSVVIPCYNAQATISKALISLQNQTYRNWEAIIVNDGSTDGTKDCIAQFKDKRIRYHEFSQNRGRGAARQKGLELASGKYLAMLDADDWIYSTKLERQVLFLEKNLTIALVSSSMGIIDVNDNLVGKRDFDEKERVQEKIDFPAIPHAPSMIRMTIAKNNRYNVNLKHSQDSDFILKCVLGRKYYIFSDILYIYTEYASVSKYKVIKSYYYSMVLMSHYFFRDPLTVFKHYMVLMAKIAITPFRTIDTILSSRSKEVSQMDTDEYLGELKLLND